MASSAHQYREGLSDVTQEQGDVGKHEEVAEQDREHICLAFPLQFILNGTLKGKTREVAKGKSLKGRRTTARYSEIASLV